MDNFANNSQQPPPLTCGGDHFITGLLFTPATKILNPTENLEEKQKQLSRQNTFNHETFNLGVEVVKAGCEAVRPWTEADRRKHQILRKNPPPKVVDFNDPDWIYKDYVRGEQQETRYLNFVRTQILPTTKFEFKQELEAIARLSRTIDLSTRCVYDLVWRLLPNWPELNLVWLDAFELGMNVHVLWINLFEEICPYHDPIEEIAIMEQLMNKRVLHDDLDDHIYNIYKELHHYQMPEDGYDELDYLATKKIKKAEEYLLRYFESEDATQAILQAHRDTEERKGEKRSQEYLIFWTREILHAFRHINQLELPPKNDIEPIKDSSPDSVEDIKPSTIPAGQKKKKPKALDPITLAIKRQINTIIQDHPLLRKTKESLFSMLNPKDLLEILEMDKERLRGTVLKKKSIRGNIEPKALFHAKSYDVDEVPIDGDKDFQYNPALKEFISNGPHFHRPKARNTNTQVGGVCPLTIHPDHLPNITPERSIQLGTRPNYDLDSTYPRPAGPPMDSTHTIEDISTINGDSVSVTSVESKQSVKEALDALVGRDLRNRIGPDYCIMKTDWTDGRPHLTGRMSAEGSTYRILLDSGAYPALVSSALMARWKDTAAPGQIQEVPSHLSPFFGTRFVDHSGRPINTTTVYRVSMELQDSHDHWRTVNNIEVIEYNGEKPKMLLGTSFLCKYFGKLEMRESPNGGEEGDFSLPHQVFSCQKEVDKVDEESVAPDAHLALRYSVRIPAHKEQLVCANVTAMSGVTRAKLQGRKLLLTMEAPLLSVTNEGLIGAYGRETDLTSYFYLRNTGHEDVILAAGAPLGDAVLVDDDSVIRSAPLVDALRRTQDLPLIKVPRCHCKFDETNEEIPGRRILLGNHLGTTRIPHLNAHTWGPRKTNLEGHRGQFYINTDLDLIFINVNNFNERGAKLLHSIIKDSDAQVLCPPEGLLLEELVPLGLLRRQQLGTGKSMYLVSHEYCDRHQPFRPPKGTTKVVTLVRTHRGPLNARDKEVNRQWIEIPFSDTNDINAGIKLQYTQVDSTMLLDVKFPKRYSSTHEAYKSGLRRLMAYLKTGGPGLEHTIVTLKHQHKWADTLGSHTEVRRSGLKLSRTLEELRTIEEAGLYLHVVHGTTSELVHLGKNYSHSHVELDTKLVNDVVNDIRRAVDLLPLVVESERFASIDEVAKERESDNKWMTPKEFRKSKSGDATGESPLCDEFCPEEYRDNTWEVQVANKEVNMDSIPDRLREKYIEEILRPYGSVVSRGRGHTRTLHTPPLDLELPENVLLKAYNLKASEAEIVVMILERMVEEKALTRAKESKCGSPCFLVPRGSKLRHMTESQKRAAILKEPRDYYRIVVDYSTVNSKMPTLVSEIANMEAMMGNLQGGKVFFTCDISQFFHSIPLSKRVQELLTIVAPNGMFYVPNVAMEGQKDIPFKSQMTMQSIIEDCRELKDEQTGDIRGRSQGYIDDIIAWANNHDDLFEITKRVFQSLHKANALISLKKTFFAVTEFDYLGFHFNLDKDGVLQRRPMQQTINAFQNFGEIKSIKSLHQLLGMVNFVDRYVKGAKITAAPLYQIISRYAGKSKFTKIALSPLEKKAVETLRTQCLDIKPLSVAGNRDTLVIQCDVGYHSFASTMYRYDESGLKVVGYHSKRFPTSFTRANHSIAKTVFGAGETLIHWKLPITFAAKTLLFIDCMPMQVMIQKTDKVSVSKLSSNINIVTRWLLNLESFSTVSFVHVPRSDKDLHRAFAEYFGDPRLNSYQDGAPLYTRSLIDEDIISQTTTEELLRLKRESLQVTSKAYKVHTLEQVRDMLRVVPSGQTSSGQPGKRLDKVITTPGAEADIDVISLYSLPSLRGISIDEICDRIFDQEHRLPSGENPGQGPEPYFSYRQLMRFQQQDEGTCRIIFNRMAKEKLEVIRWAGHVYQIGTHGLLTTLIDSTLPWSLTNSRICLPHSPTAQLCHDLHYNFGHRGARNMRSTFLQKYFNKDLGEICREIVKSCVSCAYDCSQNPMVSIVTPPRQAFEVLHVHVEGVAVRGKRIYNALMVITDEYSCLNHAVPLVKNTGSTLAEDIWRIIDFIHRPRTVIISEETAEQLGKEGLAWVRASGKTNLEIACIHDDEERCRAKASHTFLSFLLTRSISGRTIARENELSEALTLINSIPMRNQYTQREVSANRMVYGRDEIDMFYHYLDRQALSKDREDTLRALYTFRDAMERKDPSILLPPSGLRVGDTVLLRRNQHKAKASHRLYVIEELEGQVAVVAQANNPLMVMRVPQKELIKYTPQSRYLSQQLRRDQRQGLPNLLHTSHDATLSDHPSIDHSSLMEYPVGEWEDTTDPLSEDASPDQDLPPRASEMSGRLESPTPSGPFTLRRLLAKDDLNMVPSTQTLVEDKAELSDGTRSNTGQSNQPSSFSLNSILSRDGPVGSDSNTSAEQHPTSGKQSFTEGHSSRTPSFLSEFP